MADQDQRQVNGSCATEFSLPSNVEGYVTYDLLFKSIVEAELEGRPFILSPKDQAELDVYIKYLLANDLIELRHTEGHHTYRPGPNAVDYLTSMENLSSTFLREQKNVRSKS